MRDRDAIDGLILGGTELALILTEPAYVDVPILNSARIHAEAAVDWLIGSASAAASACYLDDRRSPPTSACQGRIVRAVRLTGVERADAEEQVPPGDLMVLPRRAPRAEGS